jgi:hypothetical protein
MSFRETKEYNRVFLWTVNELKAAIQIFEGNPAKQPSLHRTLGGTRQSRTERTSGRISPATDAR